MTDLKQIKQLAEQAWEGCDGCDENDKNFFINGFITGYMRKTPDEISDEDIKRGIKREWNYAHYESRHWMVEGAKWYKEKLKKDLEY